MEITGPVAAKLFVSSDTSDADLFLVLRVLDPAGKEVVFIGSNDPRTPVGLGWLRASHRKLDPERTLPYRPWHSHDEAWPLTPGVPVELDIEIWPTCIVVPPGYRVGLTVRGRDYEYDGTDAAAAARILPDERRRPLHAYRSARPAAGDLRRHEHASFRRRDDAVSAASRHSGELRAHHMIRAAIVGLGRWGRSLVTSVQGKSDDIEFRRRTYPHARQRRRRSAATTACRSDDSYQRLLDDPDVDAVVLATPHSLHAAAILAAAAAGKHVHVEKPITLDRAERGRGGRSRAQAPASCWRSATAGVSIPRSQSCGGG